MNDERGTMMLKADGADIVRRSSFIVFQFCASLKLAVIVILALAAELAIATFYEARFGSEAAQARIYSSRLFLFTLAFLAINVMAAAVIRYPWTRKQYGFAITHLGIEVLLLGCLISYMKSIDGQIALRASETAQHIALRRELLVVALPDRQPFVVPLRNIIADGYPTLLEFLLHPRTKFSWRSSPPIELVAGVNLQIRDFKADDPRQILVHMTIDGRERKLRLERGSGSKSMQTPRGIMELAYSFDALPLPFSMQLLAEGSKDDPYSKLLIDGKTEVTVRPNEPVTLGGMTFYQSMIEDGFSYMSVRRDPGWILKYSGCGLIVSGIVMMFITRR